MKDKLTLKQFILMIVGVLLFLFIISPFLEKLIFNLRYKELNVENTKFATSDFDVDIRKFTSSGKDGEIEFDLKKKNSEYNFARVDIIDDEGYIIDKQYIDLKKFDKNKYNRTLIRYNGLDAKGFNITPTNEGPEVSDSKFSGIIEYIKSIPKFVADTTKETFNMVNSVDSKYWFLGLVIFAYIMI